MESRVIVYIDGFNLYYGLKTAGWRRFYWLDLVACSKNLLRPSQKLEHVKYFTSRISGPPAKLRRQTTYIEALQTLPDLSIYYGKYLTSDRGCRNCGHVYPVSSEKMTDVNIAVELMSDAFQGGFDTALLVSADSDLVGPVQAVRRLFPSKRVIVAFPPRRHSVDLEHAATGCTNIGRAMLAKSQLPAVVTRRDRFELTCPATWA